MTTNKNERSNTLFFFILGVIYTAIFAVVLSIFLSGCYTPEKATKQMAKAYAHHRVVVAENCGKWFPPRDSTVYKTEYRLGATVYDTSWLLVDCDTVIAGGNSPVVRIPCPPATHRVDTFIDHQYHTVENTASLDALSAKLNESNVSLTKAQQKSNQRGLWLSVLIAYLLIKNIARLVFPSVGKILSKLP